MQNCPDFQSQRSHTFFLDSHFSKDSTPIDWFDSERFDEILWPFYKKKKKKTGYYLEFNIQSIITFFIAKYSCSSNCILAIQYLFEAI